MQVWVCWKITPETQSLCVTLILVTCFSGHRVALFNCIFTHSLVDLLSPRPLSHEKSISVLALGKHTLFTLIGSEIPLFMGWAKVERKLQWWPYPGNIRAYWLFIIWRGFTVGEGIFVVVVVVALLKFPLPFISNVRYYILFVCLIFSLKAFVAQQWRWFVKFVKFNNWFLLT